MSLRVARDPFAGTMFPGFKAPSLSEKTRELQMIAPGSLGLFSGVELNKAPVASFAGGALLSSRVALARAAAMPIEHGAEKAATFAAFDQLARRANVPGAPQVRVVKFLMTGVDTAKPKLHLINTKTFENHYPFAKTGLGMKKTLEEFNLETYFTDQRKNVAGTILFHESYQHADGRRGLYTFEFWPTDQVKAPHVNKVFKALKKALPFASKDVVYHPAGNTQEALLAQEKAQFSRFRIKSILSRDLFKNVTYAPMNLGEGYGYLRVYDPADRDARPPSIRDVVVLKATPNDLSHVAGMITENPQTPLSHENLKAKQNNTPNAYVKNAAEDPRIKPFLKDPPELVYYKVGAEGLELRRATKAEADQWLDTVRPAQTQRPPRNLSVKKITSLADIQFGEANKFGAKATNVAELGRLLPEGTVPRGFAVPFYFYDKFMKETGLYEEARRMIAEQTFKDDPAVREKKLKELRKKIERATMPEALARELKKTQDEFYRLLGPETPIRCRSSTNNEDLPKFNGAGLYDSFTHRPDEGHLAETVKQVYASMWNFRAFEERDFHRIDHFGAAMGVLLHKNEDDEQANGVAYTKNIYDPSWPGFYINAQVGEELVTNPGSGRVPDELLISRLGEHGEYETQHISHSNQVAEGKTVLSKADLDKLVGAMEVIQARFKRLYGRTNDAKFAMDIEFKIRSDGSLQIKQARPTVD